MKKKQNISELISSQAKKYPDKTAISCVRYRWWGARQYPSYTFKQVEQNINRYANKLQKLGVKPQDKVLFFVKPNLDFSAITFALFRLGAIVVFIDPGMKNDYFINAIDELDPDILIGVKKAHYLKRVRPKAFKNVRLSITTESGLFQNAANINHHIQKEDDSFEVYRPQKNDLAAILFTSGGTGKPKGVEYTHKMLLAQTSMLQSMFFLNAQDIDIAGFPLFSFFTLSLGLESCIPELDPSRPASADPKKLYQTINDKQATFLAGSPAIWEKLADYCLANKLKLESVKSVALFGAPISLKIHQKFAQILPNGTTYTPYGATECLPVANISGTQILQKFAQSFKNGKGICVGKPVSPLELKILPLGFDTSGNLNDINYASQGEVGEILVCGPNMSKRYYYDDEKNKETKLKINNQLWHRMGDLGYLDSSGQLWFCGRKNHSIEYKNRMYYSIQVESIFNQNAKVKKSALVKSPVSGRPVIVIEPLDEHIDMDSMFLMDLKNLAQSYEHTKGIHHFYLYYNIPVDTRHNIKINREELSKIAGITE